MRQIVQVYVFYNADEDGVYTYVWKGDEPLRVGDHVLVRDPYAKGDHLEGVVTALDSDYEGYLVIIHSKIGVSP